jgi:hypothetical protein
VVTGNLKDDFEYAAGGNYLDHNTYIFNDMLLKAEKAYVCLPSDSLVSDKQFNYLDMITDVSHVSQIEKLFQYDLLEH